MARVFLTPPEGFRVTVGIVESTHISHLSQKLQNIIFISFLFNFSAQVQCDRESTFVRHSNSALKLCHKKGLGFLVQGLRPLRRPQECGVLR